ncbi:amidohydrolase family protein [Cecembia sp.]|uniref:amidohydrolase family protein n=1 Tax=Cecembia sp. TaxID=1898110 RepID=UPI0025C568D9|nr:amidohydrolase family protein [Cecembia sp.]
MKIDAHQHFWNYDPVRDSWIDESMQVIQRDFVPQDLQPELDKKQIDGCIAVQADQSTHETRFLLELAEHNPWIKKVVGWVDLNAADIEGQLESYQSEEKLAGFRKILQSLAPEAMEDPHFLHGIGKLADYGFTYDVLIYPQHLEKAYALALSFPNQPFIIDHLAKPDIKNGELEYWTKGIKKMAELEHVFCKVSGMVTEAKWKAWQKDDFTPYLDTITAAFGTKRLVYGSDWPVCLLAATYEEVYDLAWSYYENFSREEQAAIFGGNAQRFYGIEA